MNKYIVKLFEQSPFDNSAYIKDVQILCDIETGEPFAHLDSAYNWVGEELSENEIVGEWNNKRAKHLVKGDKVVFGELNSFIGTVDSIIRKDNEDDWNDEFNLIDCYDDFSKSELKNLAKEIEPKQTVLRRNLRHKGYIFAKIKNDNINWKK